MSCDVVKKGFLNPLMIYLVLFCTCLSSLPSSLFADAIVVVDEESERRTKMAYILAGITVVGLVGAIAYIASGSGHKKHHSSDSDSSSSRHIPIYAGEGYSSYNYYKDIYSENGKHEMKEHKHDNRRHNHHHHHHHDDYAYSNDSENDASSFRDSGTRAERIDAPFSRGRQKSAYAASSKTPHQLSGVVVSHPSFSALGQGSFSAFVQLPDGTTQSLGHLPFSGQTGSALSYGPFQQTGTYAFGFCLDEGSTLPHQTNLGSIEIQVNGSTLQSHDFVVPPHPPAHYESNLYSYTLD